MPSNDMLCKPWYAMLCYAMLLYAMLCYAMLCYDMFCYAMLLLMLCYAMLWFAMLCYAMLGYAMLWYAMLGHAMPSYAMLCNAMPSYVGLCKLCEAMLWYGMLCCAVLCYAMLVSYDCFKFWSEAKLAWQELAREQKVAVAMKARDEGVVGVNLRKLVCKVTRESVTSRVQGVTEHDFFSFKAYFTYTWGCCSFTNALTVG